MGCPALDVWITTSFDVLGGVTGAQEEITMNNVVVTVKNRKTLELNNLFNIRPPSFVKFVGTTCTNIIYYTSET